jgi:hypothetical protein
MRAAILGVLLFAPPFSVREAGAQTPQQDLDALLKEYQAAEKRWNQRFDPEDGARAKVDAEARYREWPAWSFAPRFMTLAETWPADPVSTEPFSGWSNGRSMWAREIVSFSLITGERWSS